MTFTPIRSWQEYRGFLARYLRPETAHLGLLAALLAGSIALQLANPQIIRRYLDAAQGGTLGNGLALAGLAFIGIGLLRNMLTLATTYVGENVSWAATNALRADLTRHCLRLDMPFHKQHTPGELIERIDGDATLLGNLFSQFVVRVVGNALLVIGILGLLFREDWRLGLGLTLYAGLALAVLGLLQNLAVPRWQAARQADAELMGFVEERYNGVEDIVSSGAEVYTLRRLAALQEAFLRASLPAWMINALGSAATNFLYVISYGMGLGLGAWLYTHGAVSLGAAYVVVYYVSMIAGPLEEMRRQMQDLGGASAGLARTRDLLRRQPAVCDDGRQPLPAGRLSVELAGVSFTYNDNDLSADASTGRYLTPDPSPEKRGEPAAGELAPAFIGEPVASHEHGVGSGPGSAPEAPVFALRDVSLCVPAGRVLGLLGRTGSGKTTLTRLLFRLYDPNAGDIRLGGVPLTDVPLGDLRGRVGMITQDVQLFQASVRDNLAFFNPGITDGQIEYALRELGLWEWAQSLPAGLDTPLGAGGQGLSAGEAQLLAFARVFLKDPGLVILDEASSRLDPATEALLERAIGRLLADRTGIIIAHRLGTVARADDIVIMAGGCVAECGPRAVLAADPASRFAGLLRTGLEEVLA
jgi:ATP-binding cassette subfamily B protein